MGISGYATLVGDWNAHHHEWCSGGPAPGTGLPRLVEQARAGRKGGGLS